jgi:hypothetical protein
VNLVKSTGHFDVVNDVLRTKNDVHLCGALWTIAHMCQSQLGSEIVREYEWIQKLMDIAQTHHKYLVRGMALSALGFASSSNFVRYVYIFLYIHVHLNLFVLVQCSLKLNGVVLPISQLFPGI